MSSKQTVRPAVIRSIASMQRWSRSVASSGETIALVPTMGFLHHGHLSLIRKAKQSADRVIVSIFVNPSQFGPNEDFKRYPRDQAGDVAKISSVGADVVFTPSTEAIYPANFETSVAVDQTAQGLEGAVRPGHFRGVTTIVAKLFNITRPDCAVFGMKDFQQAAVLRRMAIDLDYPITFIIAPTVREKDGLAMSSRNVYLTPEQRLQATALFHALKYARNCCRSHARVSVDRLVGEMKKFILSRAPESRIDYISCNDLHTLEPQRVVTRNSVLSLAVRFGSVRLIDNMRLV